MKFPRIIRLDASDGRIFQPAAANGEWAVTGAFRFAHRDPASFKGKDLHAFKHGWLGLDSFGSATLVEVMEIDQEAREGLVRRLAAHLMAHHGAPDVLQAMEVAQEEIEFAASLCEHPAHTLLSLDREFNEQGLIEKVRIVVRSRAMDFSRVWDVETD